VAAHGAGQVRLVGEAQLGGERGQAGRALLQPVERAADPHPVAVVGERQASLQVEPDGVGSRVVWVSDLLPDELGPAVAGLMDRGAEAMRSVFGAPGPVTA
jgi:hypothetical protein